MAGNKIIISSGVTSNGLNIASGNELQVYGSAENTTLQNGARVSVLSGGLMIGTAVQTGTATVFNIESSGYASNTVLNGKSMCVQSCGSADQVTVGSGALLTLAYGGSACDIAWTPCVGRVKNCCTDQDNISYCDNYEGVYFGSADKQTSSAAIMSGKIVSGTMYVMSGGTAASTAVTKNGLMEVWSGGTALSVLVSSGGSLSVAPGTLLTSLIVNAGGYFRLGLNAETSASGKVNGTVFNAANGVLASYKITSGALELYDGAVVSAVTFTKGSTWGSAELWVMDGGSASNITMLTKCETYVTDGGSVGGKLTLTSDSYFAMEEGSKLDFSLWVSASTSTPLLNDWSLIRSSIGTPDLAEPKGTAAGIEYTITLPVSISAGTYMLAKGAELFPIDTDVTLYKKSTTAGEDPDYIGSFVIGETADDIDFETEKGNLYTLICLDGTLSLKVRASGTAETPFAVYSGKNRQQWAEVSDTEKYVVEYSKDNFAHTLDVKTGNLAAATAGLSKGTWKWRVRTADSTAWQTGGTITISADRTEPQALTASEDECGDIFTLVAQGTWQGDEYMACHCGEADGWKGTGEYVSMAGKNKFTDTVTGSSSNVVLLTDDKNGDALFLDDIYSAFPGTEKEGRLTEIKEIRAGAGDDLVDLTSQRFSCTTGKLTVRGGDGNDTIWGAEGENYLFGDQGNDRIVGGSDDDVIAGGTGNDSMHGGGGSDVFCFCSGWGNDTVEQLGSGSVILWFTSGSMSYWNAATKTYSDGTNSVQVTGTDDIALKFGNDGSNAYQTYADAGAFLAYSTCLTLDTASSALAVEF